MNITMNHLEHIGQRNHKIIGKEEILSASAYSNSTDRARISPVKGHSGPEPRSKFKVEMFSQHIGISCIKPRTESVPFLRLIIKNSAVAILLVSKLAGKPPA